MTDALVRRCNPAAPHGIAPLAGKPVVHSLLMPREIADEFPDLLRRMGIGRLPALQAPNDPCTSPESVPERLTHWRRAPGCAPYCRLRLCTGSRHGNIKISTARWDGPVLASDPACPSAPSQQADFPPRGSRQPLDRAGALQPPPRTFAPVPAQHMDDSGHPREVDAEAFSLPAFPRPAGELGRAPLAPRRRPLALQGGGTSATSRARTRRAARAGPSRRPPTWARTSAAGHRPPNTVRHDLRLGPLVGGDALKGRPVSAANSSQAVS